MNAGLTLVISISAASTSTFGWWLGLASVTNFIAAMILGCVALCWEDYVIENWHVYLVFVLITWIAVSLNIFCSRLLPLWNNFISKSALIATQSVFLILSQVYFSLVLLLASIITLLACASPNYQSAQDVFTDMTNSTGWPNDGFAFVLCLLNALYGYLGVDCGAHLCEEIPNPTANVPKVIVGTKNSVGDEFADSMQMYPVIIGFITSKCML